MPLIWLNYSWLLHIFSGFKALKFWFSFIHTCTNIYMHKNKDQWSKIKKKPERTWFSCSPQNDVDKMSLIVGKVNTVRRFPTALATRMYKVGELQPCGLGISSVYLCRWEGTCSNSKTDKTHSFMACAGLYLPGVWERIERLTMAWLLGVSWKQMCALYVP